MAVIGETDDGFLVVTPCGFEDTVSGGTPIGDTMVVLDPGHGGPIDIGAVGRNGLEEKEINLRVASLASQMLEEIGIDTTLTRTSDYASPLSVRAGLADALNAELMISIHHNAPTPGPSGDPGIEIFVQDGSDDSSRLGGLLWENTRSALGVFDIQWAAADDAGVMTVLNTRGDDAYGIIRHPSTPTTLVELGYISNPAEAELFATPLYPRVAARAISQAVIEYLETEATGSGHVKGRVFNPSPGVGQDVCIDPDLD